MKPWKCQAAHGHSRQQSAGPIYTLRCMQ